MDGFRILLVDDETVFTENMACLLGDRGYSVATANDGAGAIEALGANPFDLAVVDLKMPGMDGIATLREIKKRDIPVKVLVLTGHGSIDTAMEAVKLGAHDYLSKPCEPEELIHKIEEIRNGGRAGRTGRGANGKANGKTNGKAVK